MWIALLSLAAAADRTLALTLEGPEGPIADAEMALPYSGEHPITLGRRDYVLELRAGPEGDQVHVVMDLKRVRRSGRRRWLDDLEMTLPAVEQGSGAIERRGGRWQLEVRWAETRSPPPPTEPANTRLRYVLVWADAGLSDDARYGVFEPRDTLDARDQPSGQLTPFRVVKDFTGEILEAKAVPQEDADAHCYFRSIAGVNDWDRQFFLLRKDLATVTRREVQLDFADGTGITLGAGVALSPADRPGHYRVLLDGLEFEVPLPDDAVAWSYYQSQRFFSDPEAPALSPAGDTLGHTALGPVIDRGGERRADGLTGVRAPLVVTRAGCAELTLTVDPDQITR